MELKEKVKILKNAIKKLNQDFDSNILLKITKEKVTYYQYTSKTIFISIKYLELMTIEEVLWILHHEYRHSQQQNTLSITIIPAIFWISLAFYLKYLWSYSFLLTLIITNPVFFQIVNYKKRRMELDSDLFASKFDKQTGILLFNKFKNEDKSISILELIFGSSHPSFEDRVNNISKE